MLQTSYQKQNGGWEPPRCVLYHDDRQGAPALDFSCLDRFFFEA